MGQSLCRGTKKSLEGNEETWVTGYHTLDFLRKTKKQKKKLKMHQKLKDRYKSRFLRINKYLAGYYVPSKNSWTALFDKNKYIKTALGPYLLALEK